MTASRMGKDLQCTKAFVSPEAAYQRWELMHVYLHLHCFTNDICGYDIRQRRTSAFASWETEQIKHSAESGGRDTTE